MIEIIKDYVERVHTFTLQNYLIVNKKLNPYKCASLGYICSEINTLKCHVCDVTIKIEEEIDSLGKNEEIIDDYLRKLQKSHKTECLFSPRLLKETGYFKINTEIFEMEWENLYSLNLSSYQNLEENKNDLPVLDSYIQKLIPPNYLRFFQQEEKMEYLKKLLSIFGWQFRKDEQNSFLFCIFCGRKVSLQLFKNKLHPLNQIFEDKEKLKTFHPLDEHRYFCKWGKLDKNKKKIYGWNICLNKLYEKIACNDDEIKNYLDKKNEIARIKYEILKGIEGIKKLKEGTLEKYIKISEISDKYQNLDGQEIISSKFEERKKDLEKIFNECEEKMESITKKIKI